MSTTCPGCARRLTLTVPTAEPILDAPAGSGLVAVDVALPSPVGNGATLITLWFECAACAHPVHRYPIGHHLRVEADDRLNTRDRARDLTAPQTPVRAGGVQTPARTGPHDTLDDSVRRSPQSSTRTERTTMSTREIPPRKGAGLTVALAIAEAQDAHAEWSSATGACACGEVLPEKEHWSHALLEVADAAEGESLWQASLWGKSHGAQTIDGQILIPASRLAETAVAIQQAAGDRAAKSSS